MGCEESSKISLPHKKDNEPTRVYEHLCSHLSAPMLQWSYRLFLRFCASIMASCCFCKASRRAASPLTFLLGLFLLAL